MLPRIRQKYVTLWFYYTDLSSMRAFLRNTSLMVLGGIVTVLTIFLYGKSSLYTPKIPVSEYLLRESVEVMANNWTYEGCRLRNLTLWDSAERPFKIYDVMADSTLLLYLSPSMCGSCVAKNLHNFKQLSARIPAKRFALLICQAEPLDNFWGKDSLRDVSFDIYRCRQPIFDNGVFQPLYGIYQNQRLEKIFVTTQQTDIFLDKYNEVIKSFYD